MADFTGSNRSETWYGTSAAERAEGLGGEDKLFGRDGNDALLGGAGDDYLAGGMGADRVDGGDGNDILGVYSDEYGSDLSANDRFIGGAGIDLLRVVSDQFYVLDMTAISIASDIEQIDALDARIRLSAEQFIQFSSITGYFELVGSGTFDLTGDRFGTGSILFGDGDDIVTAAGRTARVNLGGGGGNDQLTGGDGGGSLTGGAGRDRLVGGTAADALNGNEGNDFLYGNAGNDSFWDSFGVDVVEGGSGDDIVNVDLKGGFVDRDRISGGDGYDSLYIAGSGTVDLGTYGIAGDIEFLSGRDVSLALSGEQLSRFHQLHVASITFTGSGSFVLSQRHSAHIFTLSDFGNSVNLSYDDYDFYSVQGGLGADAVVGSRYDDTLTGGGGDDSIQGGAGDDKMTAGAGADYLHGGAGNDVITVATGETLISGDQFLGGAGMDALVLQGGTAGESLLVDLGGGSFGGIERLVAQDHARVTVRATCAQVASFIYIDAEEIRLADGGTLDLRGRQIWSDLYLNDAGNRVILSGSAYGTVFGGAGEDRVVGSTRGDEMDGGAGADVLIGGEGSDRIDGGAGVDRMTGGNGDDGYQVDDSRDLVAEVAGGGEDAVYATTIYRLAANVENLKLAEGVTAGYGNGLDNNIQGSDTDNHLSGGAGNDTLSGYWGNDRLDGQTGADVMEGGLGDDRYYVDNAGDRVVESFGGETNADTVVASISYALSDWIENLELSGSANINGAGNIDANQITGNSGANELSGHVGDDLLQGGLGNDVLIGGKGADLLTGNGGADRFVFAAPGDTFSTDGYADEITDFRRGEDRIDLAGMDANIATTVNDAFKFIGSGAFSRKAGELRFEALDGGGVGIEGDLNGDGVGDFAIFVDRVTAVTASDFYL